MMLQLSLILSLLPTIVLGSPQEEISRKSPAAVEILDGWQKTDPVRVERKLHIVYWTPSDREPAPHYRERLSPILENIRKFYGTEMKHLGFGPRSFALDHAGDGLLKIHLVRGLQPIERMPSRFDCTTRDHSTWIIDHRG